MPAPAPTGFRQKCRLYFRRFRVAIWSVVFALIAGIFYLNQIGLPGFVKRPLLEKLRARGIELQFTRLRLSWHRGLVADNVRFGRVEDPTKARLTAPRAQLSLKGSELKRLDFQVGGLMLRDARLVWPLAGTNELAVEKIQAELHFLPHDCWELANLEAQFAGTKMRFTGSLSNASAIREWNFSRRGPAAAPSETGPARERIQKIADTLARIKFSTPPTLRVDFSGDARDAQSFRGTVRARVEDGGFNAQLALDRVTRKLDFSARSDFDLQKLRPLLTEKGDQWLGRFSWQKPPQLRMNGSVILPAWTNRQPDWRAEVRPTLRLNGEFKVARAAFRGVPVLAAQSHVTYSNLTWRLPDLRITRPEGELRVEHWTDEHTRDYYWQVRGAFDLKSLRPLLEPAQQRGLDLVEFTTPPVLDAEIWSRWYERERTGVKARLALSNFTFRGESGTSLHTALEYTNLLLRLIEPEVTRDEGRGSAALVEVNFAAKLAFLSNTVSTLEPMVVARAIGPKTAHALEPYQFFKPPTVHLQGSVSTVTSKRADMRLDIEGGPFRWWKFNVPHISGGVDWRDQNLKLQNVEADFYEGKLAGSAEFDFEPLLGNEFNFDLSVAHARLDLLMADLTTSSNKLEGKVTGQLTVTAANTDDWESWQGGGRMKLRDGLLWEIPIFGLFSPALDTFWPGLGSGRASSGAADFTITDSVIHSDNLELRSPAMRMQYRGTVDFHGNVDARVEAELLRNTWLVGLIVSTVLRPVTKLIEYKVTGQLSHPQSEPVYIPKLFLLPLHPIQTLKGLFQESPPATNAPPPAVEPP
jgi:hypothetical protein